MKPTRWKYTWSFVGAVISILSFVSCGTETNRSSLDDGNAVPSILGTSTLMTGVTVLDPETEAGIVSSDATSISFSGMPAGVAGLNIGDVFIARNRARKVVSMDQQGGDTTIQTSEPQLSEVFRALQLSVENLPLSEQYLRPSEPENAAGRYAKAALSPAIRAEKNGASYTISLTDPDSVLQGTLVFNEPSVTLKLNFGIVGEQYASIHLSTGESADLSLSKQVSVGANQEIELLAFDVPIPVTGGTVQVGVSFVLRLGASGNAELMAGIHQGVSYNAGMSATLDPWNVTTENGTTHAFAVMAPQFNGEVSAVVALDPNVDAQLLQYPLAGITNDLALTASASAEADPENVCFRLMASAGLSSEAYLMVPTLALEAGFTWDDFFGGIDISLQRVGQELFRVEESIYDSGKQCLVPPVADAGQDRTVLPNTLVHLDGSGSYDPTGDPLAAHAWVQLDGASVTLTGDDTAGPSFTAPSTLGPLTFKLTVTSTKGQTAEDEVMVTVAEEQMVPQPPTGVTARGGDQEVTVSWNGVVDADSYNIYLAEESGIDPTNYGSLPGGDRIVNAQSPFKVQGLTNDVTYFFVVTAVNEAGEGDPSAEVSATPHQPTGPGMSSVSAGGYYSCVVLSDGGVSCWGRNNSGQLGNGTHISSFTPVRVSGISNAKMVSSGWDFSCALLADGTVRCWGINSVGELGNGTVVGSSTPVTVSGITNATSISCGEFHSCAILEDKTIRCWGLNGNGQLGSGNLAGGTVPVEVVGISTAEVVDCGGKHSCAVLEDGTVRCWGLNALGQLGNFTNPSSPTSVEVLGISTAAAVSTGYDYSCALLKSGTIQCWGGNSGGQLGSSAVPQGQYTVWPVDVDSISSADLVAAGHTHTCANSAGGTFCWGTEFYTQEADGTPLDRSLTPVPIHGLSGADAIAATGQSHTCVVNGGTVECFGLNQYGVLGADPQTIHVSRTPVTVNGVSPN